MREGGTERGGERGREGGREREGEREREEGRERRENISTVHCTLINIPINFSTLKRHFYARVFIYVNYASPASAT